MFSAWQYASPSVSFILLRRSEAGDLLLGAWPCLGGLTGGLYLFFSEKTVFQMDRKKENMLVRVERANGFVFACAVLF